ncbi:MAG TPA: hypothetical protein VIL85_08760 [Thermomicrobiales bacterium]|jgi:hypothetical protein
MKLVAINKGGIVLELDATDCLSLADACKHALAYDMPGDHDLIAAHRTALRLGAVVAAYDTATDVATPEAELLAHARTVWGPIDSSVPGRVKAPEPQ